MNTRRTPAHSFLTLGLLATVFAGTFSACAEHSDTIRAKRRASLSEMSGADFSTDVGTEFVTPWTLPDNRRSIRYPGTRYEDQEARRGTIGDLSGKPMLVTFFYSRCQNSAKCSSAVARMAALQSRLNQRGLSDRVRLVLVTYEPQVDTPSHLHQFGADRGFVFGEDALAIRLEQSEHQRFVDDIEAPVNFNAGWVNTHGVELSLVDVQGRLVRKYQTVLWDNLTVIADLRRLLAEQSEPLTEWH